jgi:hypothetical protein
MKEANTIIESMQKGIEANPNEPWSMFALRCTNGEIESKFKFGGGAASNLFKETDDARHKFRIIFNPADTDDALKAHFAGFIHFLKTNKKQKDKTVIFGKVYNDRNDKDMQCGKMIDFYAFPNTDFIIPLMRDISADMKAMGVRPEGQCHMLYPKYFFDDSYVYNGRDKGQYKSNVNGKKLEYLLEVSNGFELAFRHENLDVAFFLINNDDEQMNLLRNTYANTKGKGDREFQKELFKKFKDIAKRDGVLAHYPRNFFDSF